MIMTRRFCTPGGAAPRRSSVTASNRAASALAAPLAGLALAVMTLGAGAARADIPADLLKCRDVTDPTQRLACYDLAVNALAQASTAASAPLVLAPADQVGTKPPAPEPIVPARDFGREKLVTADTPTPPELEELIDSVATVTELGSGRIVITLANGQIWASKESVSGFAHKDDPVRIEKGVLGGYLMVLGDLHPFRATRIK